MQAVTFVIAFIVVLALIAATAWLVRRFAGNRLGANANRGRMPRLDRMTHTPPTNIPTQMTLNVEITI